MREIEECRCEVGGAYKNVVKMEELNREIEEKLGVLEDRRIRLGMEVER